MGSCRREILDHVIGLNDPHLPRLLRDCVNYQHDDRIPDSREQDTPNRRSVGAGVGYTIAKPGAKQLKNGNPFSVLAMVGINVDVDGMSWTISRKPPNQRLAGHFLDPH